jgi:GntR family transcriptional regulator, rspAB operon transcriptional repressor
VRSALQRLAQEGLVVATRTGTMTRVSVSPLTADDMRELFLMVGVLNGVAARLAAALPADSRRRLVSKLVRISDKLGRLSAGRPSDVRRAQELDLEFHRAYERAAAGPQLLARLDALHARRERYVRVYTRALLERDTLRDSLSEHRPIVEAIERGEGVEAQRHAVFNFRNALTRYDRIAR